MSNPVIELKGIAKTFGSRTVLENLTFSIDAGSIFGFLGPNGAGKTTTMRIILGLLEPASGQALVLGSKLSISPQVRRNIGVVLEECGLYESLSATDNLGYFARMFCVENPKKAVQKALESVGLANRGRDKVGTLSTGTKRRLALARALLPDPKVLFLDEPGTGLDPSAQREFRVLIGELSSQQKMTVFLNTHNLDEVRRLCTHVGILAQGKLALCDSLAAISKTRGANSFRLVISNHDDALRAMTLLDSNRAISSCSLNNSIIDGTLSSSQTPFPFDALSGASINITEFKKGGGDLEELYFSLTSEQN